MELMLSSADQSPWTRKAQKFSNQLRTHFLTGWCNCREHRLREYLPSPFNQPNPNNPTGCGA